MKNENPKSPIFLLFILIITIPFILFAQTDSNPDRFPDWRLFGTSRADLPYFSWGHKDEDGSCTWIFREQRYFLGFKIGEEYTVEVVYQKDSGHCY